PSRLRPLLLHASGTSYAVRPATPSSSRRYLVRETLPLAVQPDLHLMLIAEVDGRLDVALPTRAQSTWAAIAGGLRDRHQWVLAAPLERSVVELRSLHAEMASSLAPALRSASVESHPALRQTAEAGVRRLQHSSAGDTRSRSSPMPSARRARNRRSLASTTACPEATNALCVPRGAKGQAG